MKKLFGILLIVCLLTGMVSAGAFAEGASGDVEIWYYWETEGHQKALSQRRSRRTRCRLPASAARTTR